MWVAAMMATQGVDYQLDAIKRKYELERVLREKEHLATLTHEERMEYYRAKEVKALETLVEQNKKLIEAQDKIARAQQRIADKPTPSSYCSGHSSYPTYSSGSAPDSFLGGFAGGIMGGMFGK